VKLRKRRREMNYTKGEWMAQLESDIQEILRQLVKNLSEIKSRPNTPDFNKGLDAVCDYDEAVEKILQRTAAPDMYGALKGLVRMGILEEFPRYTGRLYLEGIQNILAKAEGKE
jgi:hypothetical protein